ncbi:hypothetical protein B0J13DRAFT_520304 [Dactylonectria estremocensis]|uniref:Uncharacterized protein n=1 Tax=Dactylonectria estremocensis TaxID=1079267 RepID=A0A9P9FBC2_9HYPO|nr:hypothetical protein B0J13DRAFT_520304 [Dactylonectria estremocensis]
MCRIRGSKLSDDVEKRGVKHCTLQSGWDVEQKTSPPVAPCGSDANASQDATRPLKRNPRRETGSRPSMQSANSLSLASWICGWICGWVCGWVLEVEPGRSTVPKTRVAGRY